MIDEKRLKEICRQARARYVGVQEGLPEAGIPDIVLFNDRRGTSLSLPVSEFDVPAVRAKINPPERRRAAWQTRLRQLAGRLRDMEHVTEVELHASRDMVFGGSAANAWAVTYGLVLRSPVQGGFGRGVTYLRQSGAALEVSLVKLDHQKRRLARREARKLQQRLVGGGVDGLD